MSITDEATIIKFYEEILKLNGATKIKQVIVKSSEFGGDQIASQCKFVTVTFEDESVPPVELFVKSMVNNPGFASSIKDIAMFEREVGYFTEILPEMKKYAQEQPGYNGFLDEILPKCYYGREDLVVFENVAKAGFTILDKLVPHDLRTAAMVVENLAKFHGASLAYINDIGLPTFESKYNYINKRNLWSEKTGFDFRVDVSIYGAIKILTKFPVPGSEKVVEHFESIGDKGVQLTSSLYKRGNNLCSEVILHADLWNGNVMFTTNPETQELEKNIILDLQTIILGTPALDLQYYLFISLDHSALHSNWKHLLQIYYNTFTETVESLGHKVEFTIDDLMKDFQAKCPAGFIFAMHPCFVYKVLEAASDIGNGDEDANIHFKKATEKSIEQMLRAEGQKVSEKIVKAFSVFQDILLGITIKEN